MTLTEDWEAEVRFVSVITSCLLLMYGIGVAHAEKRVALVIGNSVYQNAPALINPKNDAQDIGNSLRELGFTTIVATDLDRAGMDDALDRFSRSVGGAEIALVYYSGHGMQFGGKNYLLPVDARLVNADDVNRFRLVPVDDVVDVLQGAPGARIIILDACRNNPVEDDLKRRLASMPGVNRDAFLTRGLSRVTANGLIVAYATQANDVASDGVARNSPFAQALLHNLGTPDLDLRQMLFNVQDEVDRLTDGKQRPELSISLVGQYKLNPGTGPRDNKEVVAAPVDPAAQAWTATRDTTSQAVLEDFIRQFGDTIYGSMARARLEELKNTQVAAVAPPVNPAPPPPSAATTQTAVAALPDASGTAPTGHAPTSNAGNAFDGIWQFEASGGPYCRAKSLTFNRQISQGVITLSGKPVGSIDKDGSFHFANPSSMNSDITVEAQGKIKGDTGEGSYAAIGTRCKGSYRIRRVVALAGAPVASLQSQEQAHAETSNALPVPSGAERFDGIWLTNVVCDKHEDVAGWSRQCIGKVKNGVFHCEFGTAGQPGWAQFDGTIKPDGSINLIQDGIGIAGWSIDHKTGTRAKFPYVGRLDGSHGSALRVAGRTCRMNLVKQ
jgi:Caspase domain